MTKKKTALKATTSKQKTGRSASQIAAKAAPKSKVKEAPRNSEKDNKTNQVLALLKRPGGATISELIKATDWQAHSVRGFLSGTVKKKLGLNVTSTKPEGGDRTYQVSA